MTWDTDHLREHADAIMKTFAAYADISIRAQVDVRRVIMRELKAVEAKTKDKRKGRP